VMPITRAIMAKMIGNPTDTDASAFGPRNLPTHTLSTVLYRAWRRLPANIGMEKMMICFGMLPVVKSLSCLFGTF